GQPRELTHYQELGIAACVVKPVVEEELLAAVCRARSLPSPVEPAPPVGARSPDRASTAAYEPQAQAAGPTRSRPLHVLLAQANPSNQAVLEELLPRRGHTLRVAGNGRAALTALEEGHFDVMLLDIHMPELDGFQVVAAQRRREQGTGTHLPIIALTARSAAGDREVRGGGARALLAGRHGRLPGQAGAGRRVVRGPRPGRIRRRSSRACRDGRRHPCRLVRPGGAAGRLRRR